MQVTKRQHFVWQKYLKNWCVKDKIFVNDKKKLKMYQTSTRSILAENYMYEYPILDEREIKELELYFKRLDPSRNNLFEPFYYMFRLIDFKNRNPKIFEDEFSEDDQMLIIKKSLKEGLESFHGKIESSGHQLITNSSRESLIEILKTDLINVSRFILIQYFRTQYFRDKVRDVLIDDSVPLRKAKEILTPIFLAFKIDYKEIPSFKILINKSTSPFFTSNQPVINISETNENNDFLYFMLYYPINPNLSLEIFYSSDDMIIETEYCNEEKVKYYNDFMLNNDLIISDRSFL